MAEQKHAGGGLHTIGARRLAPDPRFSVLFPSIRRLVSGWGNVSRRERDGCAVRVGSPVRARAAAYSNSAAACLLWRVEVAVAA